MAGKQARKMAEKQAFHIKDKNVLSAAPGQARDLNVYPVCPVLKRKNGKRYQTETS